MHENVDGWTRVSVPAADLDERPLWSMRKGHFQIDCRIRSEGANERWALLIAQDTRWLWCRWFETWADAVAAADDKHALLEKRGWTASTAICADGASMR